MLVETAALRWGVGRCDGVDVRALDASIGETSWPIASLETSVNGARFRWSWGELDSFGSTRISIGDSPSDYNACSCRALR
jgi:hypothetical protein